MRHTALTYIKIAIAVIIILGLGTYAYIQSREYLRGPVIEIISPANGSTVYESAVHIKGHAHNISYLSLDDREISTDTAGNFDEVLLLAPNYSILVLKARDRFGREVRQNIELVYVPQANTQAPTASSTLP